MLYAKRIPLPICYKNYPTVAKEQTLTLFTLYRRYNQSFSVDGAFLPPRGSDLRQLVPTGS